MSNENNSWWNVILVIIVAVANAMADSMKRQDKS